MSRKNDTDTWVKRDQMWNKKYDRLYDESVIQYNIIQSQADEIAKLKEQLKKQTTSSPGVYVCKVDPLDLNDKEYIPNVQKFFFTENHYKSLCDYIPEAYYFVYDNEEKLSEYVNMLLNQLSCAMSALKLYSKMNDEDVSNLAKKTLCKIDDLKR